MFKKNSQRGFSLIEVLMMVSLLAVLTSLFIVVVISGRNVDEEAFRAWIGSA